MRKCFALLSVTIITAGLLFSCSGEKKEKIKLDTIEKKFSYTMGYEAVGTINSLETVTIDQKAFIRGIKDAFNNATPQLSQEAGLQAKSLVFQKERSYRNQQIMNSAQKYKAEQKAFLEKNRKKEGVTTMECGLQYRVLKKGSGARPKPDDTVKIKARAKTLDGRLLKSLSTRNGPVLLRTKDRLPVWEKALSVMPEGGKYRFFVPSHLAYGEKGNFQEGGIVGPHQLIVLEIELIDIIENDSGTS